MEGRLPGSFRDPAGHVFVTDDILYRRIDPAGREGYEALMGSGLYQTLVAERLLVPHEDLGPQRDQPGAVTVIRPERVPMISYPYEWSFSQLKDAALLMLAVERRALAAGLSLKDASAYNVQFLRGRPVLIDTLSFEPLRSGPWYAYRQFCQHFYAPLLLLAYTDPRLTRLSQLFIDGVPLGLASRLLPSSTWLRPGPLMHVHLHAKAEARLSRGPTTVNLDTPREGGQTPPRTESRFALLGSLESAISGLGWDPPRSTWSHYYADQPSYEQQAFERKQAVVGHWLGRLRPATVWDLGANTGQFSALAHEHGAAHVVALDGDLACVELMYRDTRAQQRDWILPLVADLANPSPAIGWSNAERMTLEQRGPADLLLALALVHHLAIANNVPFSGIADYLARLAGRAIVEFVPRDDAMVRHMMARREHVFADYHRDAFERAFSASFAIEDHVTLDPSARVLYLLRARA